MAPTGPKKGGAPNGRPSRNATASSGKASTRSGISKRGNRPAKTDRDGDLNMDLATIANGPSKPSAKRSKSHTPTGPSAAPTRHSTRQPNKNVVKTQQIIERALNGGHGGIQTRSAARPVILRVEGLKASKAATNDGGGLKELLTFIERKSQAVGHLSRPIRIKKSTLRGDFVYITVSKEDSEEILKINNFLFAGATLAITEATEGDLNSTLSPTALEIKEKLRAILESRYNVEAKLLNLQTLGEDPTLGQLGMLAGSATPEKVFQALMAVCDGLFKTPQDKRNAIASISLAGNNIDDVSQVRSLIDTFPDLLNLDLGGNQFKDIKGLSRLKNRLRSLQTLLLNGNPIESTHPNYHAEVTTWFPKLLNLSGNQVRTPEQVAAEEAASRPTPIPQFGPDFRDINRVGEGFITEFLQLYDSDRDNLAAKYYDGQTTFSVSINTQSPHAPDLPHPTWGAYIKHSRNHIKINNPGPRQLRLFTGLSQVQKIWQLLPCTQHPNLVSQFDKYMIDCHPIHGLADPAGQNMQGVDGMIMTIQGEFEDQDPDTKKVTKRSFTRVFVLGPGDPARNPIRVISDMLSLRAYNPLPAQTATAQTTAPQPATTEDQRKQQMILELCKQTGMTPEYSTFCLEPVNWNFDQALTSFNEKKAQLPPQAFANAA